MITSVYSDSICQLMTPFKFFIIFNSQPRFGYSKRNTPSFTSDKEKIPTVLFLGISKYLFDPKGL